MNSAHPENDANAVDSPASSPSDAGASPPDAGAPDTLPADIPRRLDHGRYTIQELLGEGSSGEVLGATDTLLDRPVAIKRLPPVATKRRPRSPRSANGSASDGTDQEDAAARQLLEARAVARLSHPHVVACYDVFEEDGLLHLVLERVAGPTLRERLDEQGPLPLDALARLGIELASALAHSHGHGIIHRDLKPDNILLARDGTSKLTDFGIARASGTTRLTMPGQVLGTPAYVAPEQAVGYPIDGRADLYGLGCVLYEAATGAPPFQGDDPLMVVSQHLHADPAPPSVRRSDLPERWDQIIMQLLAKRPEERFESAEALEEALRQIASPRDGGGVTDQKASDGNARQTESEGKRPVDEHRMAVAPPARADGRARRILIVEDDKVLADLVKLVMENAGYEAVLAHDGLTAWERFQKQAPDLVLLDVVLPGLNGLALLKHIREADGPAGATPVVVLTGRDDQESTVAVLDAGADEYLVKPLSPDELLARIRAVLRRAQPAAA